MNRKYIYVGVVILAFVLFLANYLSKAGFFRNIENYFEGEIIEYIEIPGSEDMTVSQDGGFLIISSTDRAAANLQNNRKQGGIYFIDLKTKGFKSKLLTADFTSEFYPHGIDLIRIDSNRHRLFVINHVNEENSVEVFTLYNRDSLVFEKTLKDESMFSPNDIVALDSTRFYFTNDRDAKEGWGKFKHDYLVLGNSKITYYDGSTYRTVADGFTYSNGIRYDANRRLMYIAASRTFDITVFERLENGDLQQIDKIDCGTGVDNIEFDENNHLWVGCHPSLLTFSAYSDGKKEKSPSEIIKIEYNGKDDYQIESVFMDDGTHVSGTSTAAIYEDLIFTGNVMDDHFLVLKK